MFCILYISSCLQRLADNIVFLMMSGEKCTSLATLRNYLVCTNKDTLRYSGVTLLYVRAKSTEEHLFSLEISRN